MTYSHVWPFLVPIVRVHVIVPLLWATQPGSSFTSGAKQQLHYSTLILHFGQKYHKSSLYFEGLIKLDIFFLFACWCSVYRKSVSWKSRLTLSSSRTAQNGWIARTLRCNSVISSFASERIQVWNTDECRSKEGLNGIFIWAANASFEEESIVDRSPTVPNGTSAYLPEITIWAHEILPRSEKHSLPIS